MFYIDYIITFISTVAILAQVKVLLLFPHQKFKHRMEDLNKDDPQYEYKAAWLRLERNGIIFKSPNHIIIKFLEVSNYTNADPETIMTNLLLELTKSKNTINDLKKMYDLHELPESFIERYNELEESIVEISKIENKIIQLQKMKNV